MKDFSWIVVFCIACLPAGDRLKAQEDSLWFFQRVSHMVLFETDRHQCEAIPDSVVEVLGRHLAKYPESSILIEGRTDHFAGWDYNQRLSERRVASVSGALLSAGLPEDRMITRSYGKGDPLADNATEEGRQLNRSVRILAGQYAPWEWLEGRIVSDSTDAGLPSEIYLGNKYQYVPYHTDSSGYFRVRVPRGKIVSIEAYARGHVLERTFLRMDKRSGGVEVLRALPVRIGSVFHFDDMLFVGNQDVLLPEYREYLPRLKHMLEKVPEYRFEVQGHVNYPNRPPQDSSSFQFDLSLRRAKRIYDYLLREGIDPDQLIYNGYSNWQMRYPNAVNDEQHRRNRRVTLKVIGTRIKD